MWTEQKYKMVGQGDSGRLGVGGGPVSRSGGWHPGVRLQWHERDYRASSETDKLGLPWCAVVKNPPANAGDTGSSPGPGRSHMPQRNKARALQLLSLCSRARKPQLLSQ